MKEKHTRLLVGLVCIPVIWVVAGCVLGLLFARFGPGAGGFILAIVWGGCGLLYCSLQELRGGHTRAGYSAAAIALLTGPAVITLFSDSLTDAMSHPGTLLLQTGGLFLVFLGPSLLMVLACHRLRQKILKRYVNQP